jgi:outer membrane receptor protein involved in Fe transport
MHNNTFEDYKKAVKTKYEEEKDGKHFNYLNTPTRAKLRNLCWEIFEEQHTNQNDLNVFSSLLGLTFDLTKKNKFEEQIDKFRPIETFFKGETDPTNIDAVNLAAILVDFQPRPFNKFRTKGIIEDQIQIKNLNAPQPFTTNDENEDVNDAEFEDSSVNGTTAHLPTNLNNRFSAKKNKNFKQVLIGIVVTFCLGFALSHSVFPKKQCMQWSDDHYEKVDCISENNNTVPLDRLPLDEHLLELKKITICDTTVFFINNQATIWYAKSGDTIEYFNAPGFHPVTKKALRPITDYIINKYKK